MLEREVGYWVGFWPPVKYDLMPVTCTMESSTINHQCMHTARLSQAGKGC